MPLPPPYPDRRVRGKRKGQFAKKKVVLARENLAKSVFKKHVKATEAANPDRRIVDLSTLASQLWCIHCKIPLSLANIVGEKKLGLASVLHVKCTSCDIIRYVHTNEYDEKKKAYEVNAKLTFGMIDSGIGESHINTLLSSIDVPTVTPTTIKKYERLVGNAIEQVAKESCLEAIQTEKRLTLENEPEQKIAIQNSSQSDQPVFLKASYDSGWQKRGNGRSYNSLSGHGTAIGFYSGKVISFAVRCKDCRFCKIGHPKNDHDCRLNYGASAKSMEADMAVEIFTDNSVFKSENVQVRTLIGDEDSCTIASIRRAASHEVEKWSDYNHIKKSFTSHLYSIKLPPSLIEYFGKNFAIAIKQNKGDPTKITQALLAIVPHAYSDHSLCGDWCEGTSNENYVHKYLPQGKPLTDISLKNSLSEIIHRYAANSEKIAQCGSTQGNESLNQIIASKNPKARHYAASESLSFRIHAAICQKNIGCQYSTAVFKKIGYVESDRSIGVKKQKDALRRIKSDRITKPSIKHRRQVLKKLRSTKNAASDRREGVTYESSFALNDVSNLLSHHKVSPREKVDMQACKVLIYDLETTGTSHQDEIVQIAAEPFAGTSIFNVYIIPTRPFSKMASEITGLHICGGDLYLHENPVESVSAKVACLRFLEYLKSFKCPLIFVAHNGFSFDHPRIVKLFINCQLYEEFTQVVHGFADTLSIFRKVLPERRKQKGKFSISSLLEDFSPQHKSSSLHNAVADIKALKILTETIVKSEDVIKEHAKSIHEINNDKAAKAKKNHNKLTLIKFKGKLSPSIINKMAEAGLTQEVLEKAFKKHGKEGLRMLFTENINGKPRITKNAKILSVVYGLFECDENFEIQLNT